MQYFRPQLFTFLRQLAANNNREWFKANQERYRADVQEPLLHFVADFSGPLRSIAPFLLADPRPQGGSLFRIYRDVRFAADKSPYKTFAGVQFRHRDSRDPHSPCFYLHLEPDNVFAAAGVWHPDRAALDMIRAAIIEHPKRWSQVVSDPVLTRRHALSGDSLRRPPRGVRPDHPLIEDLKRKDFVTVATFSEKQACSAGFLEEFAATCRDARRFVGFLSQALELRS